MTTNISKEKREILINKIKEIKQFIASSPQDENTSTLLSYIADIEKDIKGKKYGLVFEEHKEAIDEKLESHTPVLSEEKDLFIDNGGQMNFLIEGDNLASLQLLEKTHKGAIDFIYIDPPYNTLNNDFVYDDFFVDSNDTFRHSKWLSFMYKRLTIAYKLLSAKGLIWISIDENELFNLKLLCDQIFNSDNFRSLITVIANPGGRDYGGIAKKTEYILVFAKTSNAIINKISDVSHVFETKDDYGAFELRELRNRNTKFNDKNRPNLCYPFYVNPNDIDEHGLNAIALEKSDKFFVEVYPLKSQGIQTVWRWGKEEKSRKNLNINLKAKIKKDGTYMIVEKYRDENVMLKNVWDDKKFRTENGSLQLKEIFGNKVFDYPKPLDIVETLSKTQSNNATILDFFAGSGTTGHAVMELNNEDGGNRKFILCTNNENNICRDVTYERIKRVIEKENYKASLKYMKVDFVPISDKLYYEYADELLKHIKELVELENGINFDGNKELAIILTEEDLDNFTNNITDECKIIYLGHNVLPTEEQEKLFKNHEIKINIIPDYYYRDLEG